MPSPDARPRLLVVDDEPAICDLIREVAVGVGYDVDVASTPARINELLGGGHSLTILDLNLTDGDGVEAMRGLSARAPGSRVMVVSGAPERVLGSAQKVAAMYGLSVVGVCAKPVSIATLRELLERSLTAVEAVQEPMLTDEQIARRVEGIEMSDVDLAYQPVIDIVTGEVVSAEAVARWADGLNPGQFVPELERTGSSAALLDHVAGRAADDRIAVPDLANLPTVAINLSAHDLESLDLPQRLHDTLTRAAPPDRWSLEITETATTTAPETALDVITRLGLMGFRLALDDFGIGSSNLERLRWYPFTELKIDKSFLAVDERAAAGDWIIVRNAVTMAQQLGLQVVAEGVEDTRTLRRLRELGCDRAQGFLISPAVPGREFGERCASWAVTAASLYSAPLG